MARQILMIAIASISLTQIAIFSMLIYLHRTLAHRVLLPAARGFCRAARLGRGPGRIVSRVAVHRKHHTFTDKEVSPQLPAGALGFCKVQLWNVYSPSRSGCSP